MDSTHIKREPLQSRPHLTNAQIESTPGLLKNETIAREPASLARSGSAAHLHPQYQGPQQSPSQRAQQRRESVKREEHRASERRELDSRPWQDAQLGAQLAQTRVDPDVRRTGAEGTARPSAPARPIDLSDNRCFTCRIPYVERSCGSCERITYCSRTCQKNDWFRHAEYCRQRLPDPLVPFLKREDNVSQDGIAADTDGHNGGLQRYDYFDAFTEHYEDLHERDGSPAPPERDEKTLSIIYRLIEELPESEISPERRLKAPPALACRLHPHQQVGFTWMVRQEESDKRGGILADAMGLGKTVQAIALMLARPSKDSARKTNLIVAPLALLRQWEREIEEKVRPGYRLRTSIVHGQTKARMTKSELLSYDVVLTTYQTICAEVFPRIRKKSKQATPSRTGNSKTLFLGTRFHRIILDEAHYIRNPLAKQSIAACSLRATYRLCMTGTPMMNKTTDIYSLIKFLDIQPYNIKQHFDQDFTRPIQSSHEDRRTTAMKALQVVVAAMLLQRKQVSQIDGRQILQLPERIEQVDSAVFSKDEEEFYRAVELRTQAKFKAYVRAATVRKNYSNILVLILRLRQCCCHPHLVKNLDIPEGAKIDTDGMIKLARDLDKSVVRALKQRDSFDCPLCEDATENPIIIDPCGHHLCPECFTAKMATSDADINGHAAVEASCPVETCSNVIDPEKVFCYSYFAQVHHAKDLVLPCEDEESDDLDKRENSVSSEDTDDASDLAGFIVDDDHATSEEEIDNVPAKPEEEMEHMESHPPATMENAAEKTDSDSDDLYPSLNKVWERASARKPIQVGKHTPSSMGGHNTAFRCPAKQLPEADRSAPKREGYTGECSSQFSRRSNESGLGTSRVSTSKQESRGQMTCEESDEDMVIHPSGKRKLGAKQYTRASKKAKHSGRARRKDKRKAKKVLTLAELKRESTKNAAAKQQYLTRLREEWVTSAKIEKTMEILRQIREENPREKVLIFSVFTTFLDFLEIPIDDAGYQYRRYDGTMKAGERDAAIDDFRAKRDVNIMLVSLMAGNAGLNLQVATRVLILDPFWNPFVEEQAIGRAHRLGQKRAVNVHRLLVEETIEDRIVALQEKKRALVSQVFDGQAVRSLSRLTVAELGGLFGIGRGQMRR